MKIKAGVDLNGLRPEILIALIIANDLYSKLGKELEITCGVDGKHGYGSLHYVGLAVDIGFKELNPHQKETIVSDLKKKLGPQYDVVLEATHIHIEFQPKVQL